MTDTPKPLCPRCGEPLDQKTNLMNERLYICHTEGCDYRYRLHPSIRRAPAPDPRQTQRKGI